MRSMAPGARDPLVKVVSAKKSVLLTMIAQIYL